MIWSIEHGECASIFLISRGENVIEGNLQRLIPSVDGLLIKVDYIYGILTTPISFQPDFERRRKSR